MTSKHPLERRRFLQIAGGAATFTALSSCVARAASIAPATRTGTIRDIEHIVVLMQENRSFDHYFGSLRGVRGFGDPHPVIQASGQPIWNQSGVLPFRPTVSNLGLQFIEDLAHDWDTSHQALNGGGYDAWVPAKTNVTMARMTRDDMPFHYALADAFTICDNYHCSLLTSTDPNRYYMWTGFTGNDGSGGGPVLNNAELGYSWPTYPERLEAAGISWKVYQDIGNGLDAAGSWPTPDGQGVRVHGPNGFYRQFTGDGPAVTAVPAGSNLHLKIANSASAAVRLTLADAYAGTSAPLTVPARATVAVTVPAGRAGGWYDMSVTAAAEPGYLRRLAGHVETGRDSISDPALGKA